MQAAMIGPAFRTPLSVARFRTVSLRGTIVSELNVLSADQLTYRQVVRLKQGYTS